MGILDKIERPFVNLASWIGSTTTQQEQLQIRRRAAVSDPGYSVMR
jgi:hypothetical protein